MYKKQRLLTIVVALGTLCFANAAFATKGRVTGVPTAVWAVNSTLSSATDSFDVAGVTSWGTCAVDSTTGFVTASMPEPGTTSALNPTADRIWSLVLAAELAGRPVTVFLDDTNKDAGGNCIAEWVYML